MMSRGHNGDCICACAQDSWGKSAYDSDDFLVIEDGQAPYGGKDTVFYGEDAADRGLKTSPVWSSALRS